MLRGGRGKRTKTGLIFGVIVSVVIAALIVGWGLAKSAEYQRKADYQTAEYAAYTYEKVGHECVGLTRVNQAECVAKATNERRANEREEQDLVAQRQSALWAYIMGAAAVIGMGLSVVGVVLVYTTFHETRKANEIATRVSAAELRPYLFVEKVTISDFQELDEPDEYGDVSKKGPIFGRVTIHLRNFGKVPARNITVYRKSYLTKLDQGRFWKYDFDRIATLVCAPGHVRKTFAPFKLNASERVDFKENILEYILRLRFTFEDDVGNCFEERSAFLLAGDEPETFYLLGPVDVAQARRDWRQFQLDFAINEDEE